MAQDPQVRHEAAGILQGLFHGLGQHSQGQQPAAPAGLNADWMVQQFSELVEMPVDLARIFMDMSVQLTELVLDSLAEAGISLVKGLTPA